MEGPEGISETVALHADSSKEGRYVADWNAVKPGSYLAEITARSGDTLLGRDVITFRRENGVAENFHREQNRELLERLSAETGGHYFRAGDARRLLNEISYSEAGITAREAKDLWNMPVVFLLAIMLRSSEWLLRRKWNTV
jgi:hypothetical protein